MGLLHPQWKFRFFQKGSGKVNCLQFLAGNCCFWGMSECPVFVCVCEVKVLEIVLLNFMKHDKESIQLIPDSITMTILYTSSFKKSVLLQRQKHLEVDLLYCSTKKNR